MAMGNAARIAARLKSAPWLWGALVRSGTRAGVSPQNWLLLETMSRPWWLYRSKGRLRLPAVEQRAAKPIDAADVALCERLIAAFALSTERDRKEWESRGIWGSLFDMHQRELAGALERGDARELARLLANMFQEEFTRGLMVHAHVSSNESWLGSRILSMRSLDVLVSLAEALGAIPVESPEQRRGGVVFGGDVAELVRRVERRLGLRVDFPDVGAPFGMLIDGRLITLETPEQIYAAVRLAQAIELHLHRPAAEAPVEVVEIGGGYGGVCHWFLRLNPHVARYTIVDLPIVNVLQGYFLSQTLGESAISLHGEPRAQVQLLPNTALAEVETPFAVLVNKDSMPEMPHDAMVSYLEWGRANCDGLFFSYNQEAGTEFLGQTEGRVPETIERLGGFTRIRRDHSWLRRGYAEEVYVPTEDRVPAEG